jgi:hypothetical protein
MTALLTDITATTFFRDVRKLRQSDLLKVTQLHLRPVDLSVLVPRDVPIVQPGDSE